MERSVRETKFARHSCAKQNAHVVVQKAAVCNPFAGSISRPKLYSLLVFARSNAVSSTQCDSAARFYYLLSVNSERINAILIPRKSGIAIAPSVREVEQNSGVERSTVAGGVRAILATCSNEEIVRTLDSFAFRRISRRLQEALMRIYAGSARGACCLCARARKPVPDSVDSSTSGCWSLEGAARSWAAAAAGKSSASTPNASKKHMKC